MSYTPRPLPPGFLARPIAHRGLHQGDVVENTAPAFAAAVAGGYGIECDVVPSLENEAIVFHDETLERLTGAHGPVAARPTAELLTVPFRRGTAGILTLESLFAQVAGHAPLVVEIKGRFDGSTPLAPCIAALAAQYTGPLAFKSFDPAQIIALREAGVKQPLGIVAMTRLDEPGMDDATAHALGTLAHLAQSRPDFLSWRAAELPHPVPARLRENPGLPVMSWTVRDQATARRIAPYVDQIVFEGFRPTSHA